MEPAHTRASRRTPALVVLVLALCLAVAAGGMLAWRQAHPAQALHLEPAGDTGAAPFLDAAHAEPATFSDTVRASVIEASARAYLNAVSRLMRPMAPPRVSEVGP